MASEQQSKQSNQSRNLQNELLIHGYCRQIQLLLKSLNQTIPVEIIEICLQFYQITAIINIAVGDCGNKIMSKFIQSIYKEYNLDLKGKYNNNDQNKFTGNTYLRPQSKSVNIPRCISIDTAGDKTEKMPFNIDAKNCLHPAIHLGSNFYGCGNNWAKGFYTEAAEYIDDAMDIIRKEIETYDEPQALQFMHSLGGATGNLPLFFLCSNF